MEKYINVYIYRRPFHEGVDWNSGGSFLTSSCVSRPFHEGVDWNKNGEIHKCLYLVALFTRAWIEIEMRYYILSEIGRSPFSRGRGLKWLFFSAAKIGATSPFSRGRGLKLHRTALTFPAFRRPFHEGVDWNIGSFGYICRLIQRRPFHEGVDWNTVIHVTVIQRIRSPFSRGRGLKYHFTIIHILNLHVALFTRAWIEMFSRLISIRTNICRPFHEGVDWNIYAAACLLADASRPFHEGVDWNVAYAVIIRQLIWSPFSRGRGLKSTKRASRQILCRSPFSRGRGLKFSAER